MPSKQSIKYINRELSWIDFDGRVLEEADDRSNPLIERLRFLGIFSNNLDEFYKVRIAGLQKGLSAGVKKNDDWGYDPEKTLKRVEKSVVDQHKRFDLIFRKLKGELSDRGIDIVSERTFSKVNRRFIQEYFDEHLRPLLIPTRISSDKKFPELEDGTLYLGVVLWPKSGDYLREFAIVPIPAELPRFLALPPARNRQEVMFLDDVIRLHLRSLFGEQKYTRATAYTIKINRDAELEIDDDFSQSVVEKLRKGIARRKKGRYVRLLYDKNMDIELLDLVLRKTQIRKSVNIIPGPRYHNKKDLMSFPDFGRPDLCFKPLPPLSHPRVPSGVSVMREMEKGDILLQFPYHTFNPVIDLLHEAAMDPQVTTVRACLYRIARDSKVARALALAAQNGKKVVVFIEAQARFDEANNLNWGEKLKKAGVKVMYTLPGLKVHAKVILITKRVNGISTLFSHIGTGNFNEKTAALYADFSLLTASKKIGRNIRNIFQYLENQQQVPLIDELLVSPFNTRQKLLRYIRREASNASKGRPAWMILKMNSLTDTEMIDEICKASAAGVNIELLIRGMCCLVPGLPGVSENVRITSIVGRFLEHARCFVFCNNNEPRYFLGSADLMTRNLDFRIEALVEIADPAIRRQIQAALDIQLNPSSKSRVMSHEKPHIYKKLNSAIALMDPHERAYQSVRSLRK
ncbi:MAG: polyphosphate kinase 1 [Bacteroidota bacterium]